MLPLNANLAAPLLKCLRQAYVFKQISWQDSFRYQARPKIAKALRALDMPSPQFILNSTDSYFFNDENAVFTVKAAGGKKST